MKIRGARRGLALLSVLWVLAGTSVLTWALVLVTRGAVSGAQNRVDWHRAAWKAEGCAAVLTAQMDGLLTNPSTSATRWRQLDLVPSLAAPQGDCSVKFIPLGATADVNRLSPEELHAVLLQAGFSADSARLMVRAVTDWRDADDLPAASGAERDWYVAAGRPLPRNGDLRNLAELRLVRGFEALEPLETVLGTDGLRIPLTHAPRAVLGTLPGMSAEALDAIEHARRDGGGGEITLAGVATRLTGTSRGELMLAFQELSALVSDAPEQWEVSIRASSGSPPMTVDLRVRYRYGGSRVAVVSQRFTP